MKINLQSLHFTASDQLKEFVNEKVSKLENYYERIISADVTLSAEDAKIKENKTCEIRLVIPGNDDFVKKSAESFEEAILNSVEALQKILRRKKEKY
jgi:putative sigma-54 modulation protein